jgi:hypothetical protein
LYQLIAQRADLTPIRSQLMADQASALTQLANFYREWEQKHCAAANV